MDIPKPFCCNANKQHACSHHVRNHTFHNGECLPRESCRILRHESHFVFQKASCAKLPCIKPFAKPLVTPFVKSFAIPFDRFNSVAQINIRKIDKSYTEYTYGIQYKLAHQ